MEASIILGAGFSKNSGIPVQSELPKLLLECPGEDAFEDAVTQILAHFMEDIFGFTKNGEYPNLDDMFTCIDISTNSGHHLGLKYSPMHLRAVRRLLVYRVFTILNNYFSFSQEVSDFIILLSKQFSKINFIVLNWDTVLEKYIRICMPDKVVDYCNDGLSWESVDNKQSINTIKLLKLHGSSNWLYCDNCRSLFYDNKETISSREKAGFQEVDFTLFDEFSMVPQEMMKILYQGISCPVCRNSISSHIATFSYRKSFRVNSFSNIWRKAEEALANSDRWIFVGYSLPDADYEFKHLLKISQLKLHHLNSEKVRADAVLLNSGSTAVKYNKFFGRSLADVYNEGIKEYILTST